MPGDWEYTLRVINQLLELNRRIKRDRAAAQPSSIGQVSGPGRTPDDELLPEWTEVTKDELIGWPVGYKPPPSSAIFELETDGNTVLPIAPRQPIDARRRADVGIWELHASKPAGETDRTSGWFLEAALQVASAVDQLGRSMQGTSPAATDVIKGDYRFGLSDQSLPVVGPGGRVIITESNQKIHADIVVRNRLRSVPSDWRDPAELYAAVALKLTRQGSLENVRRIYATLGYFELSKYEVQRWLRPAFVFFIEHATTEDGSVGWQSTIAEPATTSPEVPLHEGMGSWA